MALCFRILNLFLTLPLTKPALWVECGCVKLSERAAAKEGDGPIGCVGMANLGVRVLSGATIGRPANNALRFLGSLAMEPKIMLFWWTNLRSGSGNGQRGLMWMVDLAKSGMTMVCVPWDGVCTSKLPTRVVVYDGWWNLLKSVRQSKYWVHPHGTEQKNFYNRALS